MNASAYRVVAIRADGDRVVICVNASRDIADKVMNLIRNGLDFAEIMLEIDEPESPPEA